MLGYYIRSCEVITCNTCKISHIMPHVTAHAVMSCAHHTAHAGKLATLIICGAPGITYGHAVCAG